MKIMQHNFRRHALLRAIAMKQEKHTKLSDADKALLKKFKSSNPEDVQRIRTEVRQEMQVARKARANK